MSLEKWSTRAPLDGAFATRWDDAIRLAPGASFSLLPAWARLEAAMGRHSLFVLAEHERRRMAIVLRECGAELHSGWPWRWQAVFCDDADRDPHQLERSEAALLFRVAQKAAPGVRVRMHLPAEPVARVPGYRCGATILQRLDASNEELLAGMDEEKRRQLRRALREGYTARRADRGEDHRGYARLDGVVRRARGEVVTPILDAPGPGENWREWELPWMRLFVAERDGVAAGFAGDGFAPRALVDGRSAAVTPEGRKAGVMPLLCHHETCAFRDEGHRWFNHGGDTTFKREVAGTLGVRVEMHAWLGGGSRFLLANGATALYHRSRPALALLARPVRRSPVPAL